MSQLTRAGRSFGFAALLALVLSSTLFAQKPTVVFVVSKGFADATVVPVLVVEGTKLTSPIAGDSDPEAIAKFAAANFKPGQEMHLVFGGGDGGSLAVVKSNRESECAKSSANVTLKTMLPLGANVMALATLPDAAGRGQGIRRAPTPGERADALAVARAAFAAKGVAAALLDTISVVNLTAVDMDRDGRVELVGSFVAKKTSAPQTRDLLFLIAEPQGATYRATLAVHHRYTTKDVMQGADIDMIGSDGIYMERLVDHLDVDNDGTPELITMTAGLEGDTYQVYKKSGAEWREVFKHSNYRCAF